MAPGSIRTKNGHENCRNIVCFFCKKKGDNRFLTKDQKEFISKELLPNFYEFEDILPTKTCSVCRATLSELKNNGDSSSRHLKLSVNEYKQMLMECQKISTTFTRNQTEFDCTYTCTRI